MEVFRTLESVPGDFGATVVGIGNFDGVHRAHQYVLKSLVRRAHHLHVRSLVVTFDPHPVRVLRPQSAPRLLTPLPLKLRYLAETGVDAVLVLPFTSELSLMSAQEFASEILSRRLHAKEVHQGFNFRFGHHAEGNTEKLAAMGRELGFEVKVYPEMKLRGHSVSSSEIRRLLSGGQVSRARTLLGRSFSILSHPSAGRGYGHKYTVPTINMAEYSEMTPANGVYITRTRVDRETFDSITNVGIRPTFADGVFSIETHLLDFHPLDLTATTDLEVEFLQRVRPEIKFPNTDALKEQIGRDIQKAQRYFALHTRYAR